MKIAEAFYNIYLIYILYQKKITLTSWCTHAKFALLKSVFAIWIIQIIYSSYCKNYAHEITFMQQQKKWIIFFKVVCNAFSYLTYKCENHIKFCCWLVVYSGTPKWTLQLAYFSMRATQPVMLYFYNYSQMSPHSLIFNLVLKRESYFWLILCAFNLPCILVACKFYMHYILLKLYWSFISFISIWIL